MRTPLGHAGIHANFRHLGATKGHGMCSKSQSCQGVLYSKANKLRDLREGGIQPQVTGFAGETWDTRNESFLVPNRQTTTAVKNTLGHTG